MFLITKDQRKCHLKVKANLNGIRHNIKPFIRQTTMPKIFFLISKDLKMVFIFSFVYINVYLRFIYIRFIRRFIAKTNTTNTVNFCKSYIQKSKALFKLN